MQGRIAMRQAGLSNEAVVERLAAGRLIEGPLHASEDYLKALARTLIVSADTELISAPSYLGAAADAPDTASYMSVISIVQDELGHAHIAYRMLRDLGVDVDELVYGREPHEYKHPYAFDVPLETWVELVVANAFYDRAGFVLLSDVFEQTTNAPCNRALLKVERDETFHLRNGERWISLL
jgi:ring-1,2-phenylacetyl-CoA epoxidase subunit PaaA